jgi:orotate phosphoribosyltransferase
MLRECGALLEGHFLLTSGRHSARYFQAMRLLERPDHCARIAADIAHRLPLDGVAATFAPAIGGITFGYELARAIPGVRALFAERVNGAMQLRRGFNIEAGERLILAEDVITTGGSVLELKALAEAAGAEVVAVACILDRSQGAFRPGVPVAHWIELALDSWPADSCPLCAAGAPAPVKPGSRT